MSKKQKFLDSAIFILGLAGMAIMSYLVYLHYSGGESAFCDISEQLQCSVVNQSIYSDIYGIPVSLFGLLFFVFVAAAPYIRKRVSHIHNLIAAFTLFSLVFSFYLTYVEIFVLSAVCIFCEAAKTVMLLLLITCIWSIKSQKKDFLYRWYVGAVLLGAIFTAFAYFAQTSPSTGEDYTPLTECLREKNVVMYGAFWCPKCARQKRDLGDAFQYVNEIECDPRGEDAHPELCLQKDIKATPTWLQEENGQELKRLEGYQAPQKLAEEFNCPLTNQ